VTTPERWNEVERIYHAALARDTRERAAFVREESGGDEEIAREVESLLACESGSERLLSGRAIDALAVTSIPDDIPEPLIGHRLGQYAVEALLGFGGMGDVYRAHDLRLGRDVAIKILPEMFAADPGRRARFEREARMLASLNHPNIGAIYGFEDSTALHALVLELVDGQTLHDRLQSRPMAIHEAMTIAGQIASALEAAHARGIVHRDLKPRNIAISGRGTVKVLDFGLAKAAFDDAGTPHDVQTRDGMILGTTAYMSPEQARGVAAGKEADVWAFGCVLVEMLIGRRVFLGDTTADIIAASVEHEPPWHLLPAETPAAIVALARRCLEKDPSRRLHDISDARAAIEGARAPAARRRHTWRWAAAAVALGAVVAGGIAVRAPRTPAPTHVSLSVPGTISPQLSATLSPDGRRIAFVATGGSGSLALWIRDLDSPEPRVLPGTENAAHPFWSPDGRFIGFLADGQVKTLSLDNLSIRTLAETPERAGPSWSRSGQILFVSKLGELGAVSANGGPGSRVTTVVPNQGLGRYAVWPHFLPDGRHFLFFMRSPRREDRGIYAGSLDSPQITFVVQSEYKGAYAAGHLLFVRGNELVAQPFDVTRLALSGAAVHVADGVWAAAGAGQASFSVSEAGTVAYVNASVSHLQLAWFDRSGRALEHVGDGALYSNAPQLSGDASRVLVTRIDAGVPKIWSIETATERAAEIAPASGRSTTPVWSPDGKRVAYQTPAGIAVRNADGSGREDLVLASERQLTLTGWSPDERHLLYAIRGPASLSDLWLLPLDGARRPVPYLETGFNKTQAQISPDGRWIAYTSYESGRDEVYVARFPVHGEKQRLSAAGGVQPRWRGDGAELFYVAPDSRLMAIAVDTRTALHAGEPSALFKTRVIAHGSQSIGLYTMYDVSRDGRRFLTYVPADDSGSPISVILNWTAALR